MQVSNVSGGIAGTTQRTQTTTVAPHAWLASELIGLKVVSQTGESLGKIEDVVVHPGNRPSYAVLSFGGWLGMGDKLFALPWSVLRTVEADTTVKDSARALVLPVSKERFKTAPGFDKANWPDMANHEWTRALDTYYSADIEAQRVRPASSVPYTNTVTWKASSLKGADVRTPGGEKLGDIRDLAIDTNGRVMYAALSVGGFLGMGERVVAVPWDSLIFARGNENGDKKLVSLVSTKAQLEQAPQFKTGAEYSSEMRDPRWTRGVYDHFAAPAYWETVEVGRVETSVRM
jgi:sporulation protein YlmC with PRC-barrel domain